MPTVSDGIDVGTIVCWLKQVGDSITKGEGILQVDTDKAVVEIEARFTGTLAEILHGDHTDVPVGSVIGYGEVEQ